MERNILVDKLKGYACFLVLFGHVIMGIRLAGVAVPSFFEGMEQFLWSFHVGLFLFLSGVVYQETGGWQSKQTRLRFITHKLLNLGIPYVVFSAIYIAINSLVGETNTASSLSDILFIFKTPVAQYWFLYALFFLFFVWALLSKFFKNWQITLAMVALGYVLSFFGITLGSFDVVFHSALAFGAGTFICFQKLTKLPFFAKILIVVAHLSTAVVLIVFQKIEDPFFKELLLLFGIYSAVLLISLLQNLSLVSRFLLFVNRYSFQIYLLHTLFTAGIRIMLLRLGITQWTLHTLLGTVGGLVFSVLAAQIAKKIPFLNFFFFPTKYLPKRNKA